MTRVFRSFEDFERDGKDISAARPIVTVGSFDGVHLGHRYLIAELVEWARRERAPALALTFVMHPREFMTGRPIASLSSPEHKQRLIVECGPDALILVNFDKTLQDLSAEGFVSKYIKGMFNARGLLVGFNNRIGKDGEGNYAVLRALGKFMGLTVREAESVEVSGQAMSSSVIRQHIAKGDFLWARKMLGRPFSIVGQVIKGDQRGREIGFPTANLALATLAYPPQGVYAVRVRLEGKTYLGAANIGTRPTVDTDRTEPLLEVHLLDFDGDCYGKDVEVEFLFKVRDERKFPGVDALKEQLKKDVAEIRKRVVKESPE